MKLKDHINSTEDQLKGFSVMVNGKRETIKRMLSFCISTNECCIELASGRLPRISAESKVWLVAGRDLNA